MKVTLPAGNSHAVSGASAWTLTTTLDAPTTGRITTSCTTAGVVSTCSFGAALAANTAYGL